MFPVNHKHVLQGTIFSKGLLLYFLGKKKNRSFAGFLCNIKENLNTYEHPQNTRVGPQMWKQRLREGKWLSQDHLGVHSRTRVRTGFWNKRNDATVWGSNSGIAWSLKMGTVTNLNHYTGRGESPERWRRQRREINNMYWSPP